ncbi:unnamed protein product [Gadus morhua 'NCC']
MSPPNGNRPKAAQKRVFEECPKIKNKQIPAHKPARTNPLLTTLTRGTSDGEEKLLQREPSPNRDGQPALPGESPQHPRFSCEMTEDHGGLLPGLPRPLLPAVPMPGAQAHPRGLPQDPKDCQQHCVEPALRCQRWHCPVTGSAIHAPSPPTSCTPTPCRPASSRPQHPDLRLGRRYKARSAEDVGYSRAFVAEVEQALALGMIASTSTSLWSSGATCSPGTWRQRLLHSQSLLYHRNYHWSTLQRPQSPQAVHKTHRVTLLWSLRKISRLLATNCTIQSDKGTRFGLRSQVVPLPWMILRTSRPLATNRTTQSD